jgi:hypothetical protein
LGISSPPPPFRRFKLFFVQLQSRGSLHKEDNFIPNWKFLFCWETSSPVLSFSSLLVKGGKQNWEKYTIWSLKGTVSQDWNIPSSHFLLGENFSSVISLSSLSTLQRKGRWESNINVLFGISFTLKANKKLTTRINCFH